MNTLFLNMPGGYEYMPYLAIPLLKAYINSHSKYHADAIDLNIIYYDYTWKNTFCSKLARILSHTELSNSTNLFYYCLSIYLSRVIEDDLKILKSAECYSDKNKIRKSLTRLQTVERIIKYVDRLSQKKGKEKNINQLISDVETSIVGEWLISYFEKIDFSGYDVICFSVTYDAQLLNALFFSKLIKEKYPKKKIVFGGNLMTFYKEEILNDRMFWNYFDYCIFYQGEKALVKLFDYLASGHADNLDNIAYYMNEKVIYTKNEEEFNCEFVVPDFDDVKFHLYPIPYRIIPLLASKGCYWSKCKYCAHFSGYGSKFQMYEETDVCSAITELKERYNYDYIYFVDEAMPYRMMENIAAYIKKERLQIKWFCEARVDKPMISQRNLRHLKEGGCIFLINGIESGCQKVLNEMGKGIQLEDVEKYLEYTNEIGIGTFCMYFIGYPTETYNEAEQTFRFIKSVKDIHTMSTIGFFCLERGTDIYIHPEKYNISKIINKGQLYNTNPDYYLESPCSLSTVQSRKQQLKKLEEQYSDIVNQFDEIMNRESTLFLFEKGALCKEVLYDEIVFKVILKDIGKVEVNLDRNTLKVEG